MHVLKAVSAAQLAVHLVQARTAIRYRIPFDLPVGHGRPENIHRDMWFIGSGMAAPWPLLAAQTAGTIALFRPHPRWLPRAMGWLGVVYVAGYLVERSVRDSFRNPNAHATALNAAATILSAVMAVVGLAGGREPSGHGTRRRPPY